MGDIPQRCLLEERSFVESSSNRQDGSEPVSRSLYDSNGRHTRLSVRAKSDIVTINEHPKVGVSFKVAEEETVQVVDVDSLTFQDGSYGVVVAVKSSDDSNERLSVNRVYLYGCQNYSFHLVRTIDVPGTISCVRTLISPAEMESQRHTCSAKIATWMCVVGIGCENAECYISPFINFDPMTDDWKNIQATSSNSNALKGYLNKNYFEYVVDEQMKHRCKREEVSVTALSYVPYWGTILVGLSFGGIVLMPLDGKSVMVNCKLSVMSAIRHFAILEAEYDTMGGFFVFTTHEKTLRHPSLICTSRKIDRVPVPGEDSYEYQDTCSVGMMLRDGARWTNLHTMVKKRSRKDNDTSSHDNTTLPVGLNTSQALSNGEYERTMMFYSYESIDGRLKGGVFDLNCHYSRRMSTSIIEFKEYGQHPICSQFIIDLPRDSVQAEDVTSVWCLASSRYSSPLFINDALFAPMSYRLQLRVYTATGIHNATLQSLQEIMLRDISCRLRECLSQPDSAVRMLEFVGLVHGADNKKAGHHRRTVTAEHVPVEVATILRAMLSDRDCRGAINRYIAFDANRQQRLIIGRWMWSEMVDCIKKMDETVKPLFESSTVGSGMDSLEQSTARFLEYCPFLLKTAELVFHKLHRRGIDLNDDTPHLRSTRQLHSKTAFTARFFLECVHWFTRVLPPNEPWNVELREEIASSVRERREVAVQRNQQLYIDAVLSRLYDKSMDDEVWCDLEPVEWYPPSLHSLLYAVRIQSAPMEDKIALLVYYLMDVDKMMMREAERSDEEKKGYPLNMPSFVHSFLDSKGGNLFDQTNIIDSVTKQWRRDCREGDEEEEVVDGVREEETENVGPFTAEERAEVKALMAYPLLYLGDEKEDRLRALLTRLPFGEYRWNLYLIKKGRFAEVDDLPVPTAPGAEYPHDAVFQYSKYKNMVMKRKAELPPARKRHPGVASTVSASSSSPSTTSPSIVLSEHVTLVRGKTPKRLNIFRKASDNSMASDSSHLRSMMVGGGSASLQLTPPSVATNGGSSTAVPRLALMTPKVGLRRAYGRIEEDEEGDESDVAPDEKARVREALRTPRTLRHHSDRVGGTPGRVAAAADGIITTPENIPRVPEPMSILKSARKDPATPSVLKSRLRFAERFDEKTISPRESVDSSIGSSRMSQPNFDDDFDDDEGQVMSTLSSRHSVNESSVDSTQGDAVHEDDNDERGEESMRILEDEVLEEEEEDVDDHGVVDEHDESVEVEEKGGAGDDQNADDDERGDEYGRDLSAEEQEELERAIRVDDGNDEEEVEEPSIEMGEVFIRQVEVDQEESSNDSERGEEYGRDLPAPAPVPAPEVAIEEDAEVVEEEQQEQPAEVQHSEPIIEEPVEGDVNDEEKDEEEEERHEDEELIVHVDEEEEKEVEEAPAVEIVAIVEMNEESDANDVVVEEAVDDVQEEQMQPQPAEEVVQKNVLENVDEHHHHHDESIYAVKATIAFDLKATEGHGRRVVDAVPVDQHKEHDVVVEQQQPAADEHKVVVEIKEERTPEPEDAKEPTPEPVRQATPEPAEERVLTRRSPSRSSKKPVPPVPKPRTIKRVSSVFKTPAVLPGGPTVPMEERIPGVFYMDEDGIERSFEEERRSSDEEEEEQEKDTEKKESTSRKRRSSGTRKASEMKEKEESPDILAPLSSPPRKKQAVVVEEEEEEEDQDDHHKTTTTTRVVEEQFVERDDGIVQHTVRQSTRVIVNKDGEAEVVDDRVEEVEEVEGDIVVRNEVNADDDDGEGRTTPAVAEQAVVPDTTRRSSRAAASASRERTASVLRSVSKKKKVDEDKKNEDRDHRETTPLVTPKKTPTRGRRLNFDEDEGEEGKKEEEEEPMTPTRRSTRTRKPSEASSVTLAQTTPSKRSRRTPSREPSVAASSPVRVLSVADDDDQQSIGSITPSKRGRGRPPKSATKKKDEVEPEPEPEVQAPIPARRKSTARTTTTPRARSLSTSVMTSSAKKPLKKTEMIAEEDEEDDDDAIDHMAALQAELAKKKAEAPAKAAAAAKRLKKLQDMVEGMKSIPEGATVEDDGPSTSRASAPSVRSSARKRTQSENVSSTPANTPAKKKGRVTEDTESNGDHDETVADTSMLRRSTRRAVVEQRTPAKTPSKKK